MNRPVFIIHTEYHLIQAIGIIRQYFMSQEDEPYIIQISPIGGTRLQNIDVTAINACFQSFFFDYSNPGTDLKCFLDSIVCLDPTHLMICHDTKFWIPYLVRNVKKKICKVILLPDGANLYVTSKMSFFHIIKDSLKNTLMNVRSHLFPPIFIVPNFNGGYKGNDEVWIENVDACSPLVHGVRKQICYEKTGAYMEIIKRVFRFDSVTEEKLKEKLIVFFDSPLSDISFIERNIELISYIKQKHPERKVAIKLHQNSDPTVIEKYKVLGNVEYLNTTYPAEIIVALCQDAYLYSMVSTTFFIYNPKCKYHWLYPLYNDLVNYQSMRCPFVHIKIINGICEI